jgi:hypothetical protein
MARPLITPGVPGAGAEILTAKVWAEELPQELPAVTETVPPVEPAVAMKVLVVLEFPVQPPGSDHV